MSLAGVLEVGWVVPRLLGQMEYEDVTVEIGSVDCPARVNGAYIPHPLSTKHKHECLWD